MASPMNTLVDRMVEQGLIDDAAARAVTKLLASGEPPARAFATCGIAEEQLLRFWSDQFDWPYVELERCSFSKAFLARFPARILLDKRVIPVENGDDEVIVVTNNPFDTSAIDELRLAVAAEQVCSYR